MNDDTQKKTKVQLSGRVISISDVATIPDFPYSAGMVFAVRASDWEILTDRVGFQGPFAYAQFALPRGAFDELVLMSTAIGADGRYMLDLESGSYVMCVGNLAGQPPDTESYPVAVNGCLAPLTVSGEQLALDIFFGEGGVTGR